MKQNKIEKLLEKQLCLSILIPETQVTTSSY